MTRDDDLLVKFLTLRRLTDKGDQESERILFNLDEQISKTPQGQSLLRLLPLVEAMLKRAEPFCDKSTRLEFMAKYLSELVSRDCCLSPKGSRLAEGGYENELYSKGSRVLG